MTTLTTWLQSGGEFLLIDVAVKAFVLSALALFAAFILKRASAAVRHLVWWVALAAMLLLPILTLSLPSLRVSWMPQWNQWALSGNGKLTPVDVSSVSTSTTTPPMTSRLNANPVADPNGPASEEMFSALRADFPRPATWNLSVILAGLWGAGSLMALIPILVGLWGLKVLRAQSQQVTDSAIEGLVEEARPLLRIGKRIQVRRTALTTMPVTWGTRNPVLLLPETFFDWTPQRQRVVILHELAHIKRRDWLTQLVAQFTCAVYWFNPLVWLAARDMRTTRELASDDLVLRAGSRPADYADELLAIAINFGERRLLYRAAGVPMARRSTLDGRLVAILDQERNRSGIRGKDALTVAACFAAVAIPLATLQARPLPADTAITKAARSEVDSSVTMRQKMAIDAGRAAPLGAKLDPEAVANLEEKLANDEEDLDSRVQLLGYYNAHRYRDPSARKAHAQHVLWLIEHHPEHALIATPYGHIDSIQTSADYDQGKKLLKDHLEARPNDLDLLANAASYFAQQDKTLSVELLQRARLLDSDNPYWPENLGLQYRMMGMSVLSLNQQREFAQKSFDSFERAYAMGSDLKKKQLLPYLAKSAFAAGQFEKAEQYAQAALRQGDDSGDYHFTGHMILGRLALTRGDVEAGKRHLLQSTDIEGSPTQTSFGPNMSLAKDLIEREEMETVLAFFESCGKFWNSDNLDKWTKDVRQGRMPDFGANLQY